MNEEIKKLALTRVSGDEQLSEIHIVLNDNMLLIENKLNEIIDAINALTL